MSGAFEVVSPMSHAFNNGEHFAIVDIVVAFGRKAFSRVKGYRVPSVIVKLANDTRDGETRSISVDTNGKIGVKVSQDRSRGEAALQFGEGVLRLEGPVEPLVLLE
jgi:hypothetical protein